jgi:serine/threonine-protein kinase
MNHPVNIPNHTIVRRIGEGGMGVVFLATDNMLQRYVAVKALKPDTLSQAETMQRFRSEAVTLARLSHPCITMLYNLLQVDGRWCMIMEYVEGETLESILKDCGVFSVEKTLNIAGQTLEGLHHAHDRGVIHRDLKPSNLMLSADGKVKIMDFGIARIVGHSRLTRAGQAAGTPHYMSPEQVMGHEGSHASDIYSLGVVMYELLTGVTPFTGDCEFEIMQAHASRKPVSPSALNPSIPAALSDAIMKALAKMPAQRYADAGEFGRRLQQIAESITACPPKRTPPGLKLPTLPDKWKLPGSWKLPALPAGWKLPANIDRQYLAGGMFLIVSLLVACFAIFSGGGWKTDEDGLDALSSTDSAAVAPRIEVATDMDMSDLTGRHAETPPADRLPATPLTNGDEHGISPPVRRTDTGDRKKVVPSPSGKKDKKDKDKTPDTPPPSPPEKPLKDTQPKDTQLEDTPSPDTPLPKDSPPEVLPGQVVIPRGTRIDMLLDDTYEYASTPDGGVRVTLSVTEPVIRSGVTVVRAGAKVHALLHKNTRRRELELEMQEVESVTGQRLKSLKATFRSARFVQGAQFHMNLEYNRVGK